MPKLFDLKPIDLKPELNPVSNPNGYLGANSALDPAYSQVVIDEYSSYVIDRLPPRYKRLARYIDGLWIYGAQSRRGVATGGETVIDLGMKVVSDVGIYRNFSRSWDNHKSSDAIEASSYVLDPATGKITFGNSPFEPGDTLIATFAHDDLSRCLTLRRIVKNLVISHLAKELFTDEAKLDNYGSLETQAYVDLSRISNDPGQAKLNLSFFDDLELISETVNDKTSGVTLLNYASGLR